MAGNAAGLAGAFLVSAKVSWEAAKAGEVAGGAMASRACAADVLARSAGAADAT